MGSWGEVPLMIKAFTLTGLLLATGCSLAVETGPICQWYRDPTTTMAIHWIQSDSGALPRAEWKVGKAGFGYGDEDDQTVLDQMKGNYRSVFIRRPYRIPDEVPEGAQLVLSLRYDDGFVAYLDGQEVARKGVTGSGNAVQEVKSHEADVWERFTLGPAVAGATGIIAIEGHNDKVDSSDFTLRPRLDLLWEEKVRPVIPEGAQWAYLGGEIPQAGWKGGPVAEGKDQSLPAYRLAYRPVTTNAEGGPGWVRPEVRSRPFGPTGDLVFSVDLAGLEPGTRYEFMIARGRTELGPWYFE
ncbi:MAG: hypothetical protein GWO24_34165, partial [Akkermansiaceae bacterium]|nr:hypothetical protein [Akkermansiaceae bacterium]